MRLSIKLGALCGVAVLIPLLILTLVVSSQVSSHSREEALDQLRGDARFAASLCEKRVVELRMAAQSLADEIASRALVSTDGLDRNNAAALARLQDILPRVQADASLDFVIVTDPLGRVIARHNDRPSPGETLLGGADKNLVAERVIARGNQPVSGIAIERGDRYARLGLDRIAQVRLSDGSTVDEALVIEAGAPIFGAGRFLGVALIGQMLNTYYKPRPGSNALQTPLIAEARQLILRRGEEDAGALISLGGAIVASSVPAGDAREPSAGPSLLGALHDVASADETLRSASREFVASWQMLKSIDGTAVGAIGVVRPAAELGSPTAATSGTMLLITTISTLLAAGVGFFFGRTLGARIDDLVQAANRWSVGELSASARDRDPLLARWIPPEYLRDEINELARQLDRMRESFRQAIERMRRR